MKRYQLAPYVSTGFEGKKLSFGFGSIQQYIEDETHIPAILDLAIYWKTPQTIDDARHYLKKKFSFNEQTYENILSLFIHHHYLMEENLYQPEDRYSRHWLYYNMSGGDPHSVQKLLGKKHVILLGCGGIGNVIGVSLATAGIGKLTLIDDDVIEVSNLTRQIMFTEEDVGKNKVSTLKNALQKRNRDIAIDVLDLKITQEESLSVIPHADLIVLSADKPHSLVWWLNNFCIRHKIPFVNVGYVQDIAVWGPFVIPGQTGCMKCKTIIANTEGLSAETREQLSCINQGKRAPSIGPVNMLAASQALLDILKFLGNFGTIASLNKRIGVWTDHLRIETQDCSKDERCLVCSHL